MGTLARIGLGFSVLAMTACTSMPSTSQQDSVTNSTVDAAATQQADLLAQYRSDKFDPSNAKGERPDPKREIFSYHTSGVPYWMSDRAVRGIEVTNAIKAGTPAIDLFLGELGSRADKVRRRGYFGYGNGYSYHFSAFGRNNRVTEDNFTTTSFIYKRAPKESQNQIKQHVQAFLKQTLTQGPVDVITQEGPNGDIRVSIDSGDDRGYKFTQLRKLHMQGYKPGVIAANFGRLPWDNKTLNQWRNMCADQYGVDASVDWNKNTDSVSYSCAVSTDSGQSIGDGKVGEEFYKFAAENSTYSVSEVKAHFNNCYAEGKEPGLYRYSDNSVKMTCE